MNIPSLEEWNVNCLSISRFYVDNVSSDFIGSELIALPPAPRKKAKRQSEWRAFVPAW